MKWYSLTVFWQLNKKWIHGYFVSPCQKLLTWIQDLLEDKNQGDNPIQLDFVIPVLGESSLRQIGRNSVTCISEHHSRNSFSFSIESWALIQRQIMEERRIWLSNIFPPNTGNYESFANIILKSFHFSLGPWEQILW